MRTRKLLAGLLVLLSGAMPLATAATCHRTQTGFGYDLFSTNDDLVDDVFELVFGDEDD